MKILAPKKKGNKGIATLLNFGGFNSIKFHRKALVGKFYLLTSTLLLPLCKSKTCVYCLN
jgi:hypothetical protein